MLCFHGIFVYLWCQTVIIFHMKSNELNKLILSNGWQVVRQSGSHIVYKKNGRRYVATFH